MTTKPIRILHVVGGMDRGGVETWLMHVLRHIDRDQYQMDFLVHTEKQCAYDDEILALGSRIIPCMHPSRPFSYGRNFRQILREYGPYDVVHSHVHHFSGYTLWLAKQAGVGIRIAHSHSDTSRLDKEASLQRLAYHETMCWLIKRHATKLIAVSKQSAAALFGEEWQTDQRAQVVYYGIDLEPFTHPVDKSVIRSEMGIPENAFVVGHVGRFADVKNHAFLVEVFHELAKKTTDAFLLLVGDGQLKPDIERRVYELELTERVCFAGLRGDIPRVMRAMDVFVMPSLYEGLGLVVIEAQATGIPCVIADIIPEEVNLLMPLIFRLSLKNSQAEWSRTILETGKSDRLLSQKAAYEMVAQSPFNLRHHLNLLVKLYAKDKKLQ
jgi:glycosyltransferase involved in cell wall biosynthesis